MTQTLNQSLNLMKSMVRRKAKLVRRGHAWLLAATLVTLLVPALVATPTIAATPVTSPHIEDMTWTELRDRLKAGATTVLVPIGGTEQSGPHIVLGKHNVRVRVLAQRIALKLGNAVVAPVMAYVPEGSITPPAAHMRFTGTISIPDATFESMLDATARSFCQHGFRDVFFLGDHGGYQKNMERVALKLNRELAALPACRVHALLDYYRVTQTDFVAGLKARGFSVDEIGTHAGLADTALTLATDPALVRREALVKGLKFGPKDGVYGDPTRATVELGQAGMDDIVETSVTQIRTLSRSR